MQTTTNERAAPSPKNAARTTNGGTLRRDRRERQGAGRRFGMSVGEAISLALALNAAAGGQHGTAAQ